MRRGTNMLAARMLGTSFPYGTLSANLIRCFLMAVIMETFALQSGLSMQARLFLTTGFELLPEDRTVTEATI